MLKSCETYSASSINEELLGAISAAVAACTSLCSASVVPAPNGTCVFSTDVQLRPGCPRLIWKEGVVLPTPQAL